MDFDGPILTTSHVVISLVAIASGAVVAYGFVAAKRLDIWTASFLVTTLLTSVTGFVFFPIERFTPALGVGAVSLIVLAVAILGRYRYHLAGRWRAAYVISSVAAFYFNVFVLVAQLFQKVPALKDLAPTQAEPPFVVAQFVIFVACVTIGIVGTIRFRPELVRPKLSQLEAHGLDSLSITPFTRKTI
jgi:hypothetical protein